MNKQLILRELINFYDYMPASSRTHASAINAVIGEEMSMALLTHYFQQQGWTSIIVHSPCNQGTASGYRLDYWLFLESGTDSIGYQVEIKNWSAHSVGGRIVKPNASKDWMKEYRLQRWLYQFDIEKKVPSQKETLKVLTRMRLPEKFSKFNQQSLLCFWEPIHERGDPAPLFEVDVCCESFNRLTVFSVSNYVSQLLGNNIETIEINLPSADARIDWLNRIYS